MTWSKLTYPASPLAVSYACLESKLVLVLADVEPDELTALAETERDFAVLMATAMCALNDIGGGGVARRRVCGVF